MATSPAAWNAPWLAFPVSHGMKEGGWLGSFRGESENNHRATYWPARTTRTPRISSSQNRRCSTAWPRPVLSVPAIREFSDWYCSEPPPAFNKTVVTRYRTSYSRP